VDCIVRKGSPYRRVEFERRQRITIKDFSTWIASKEDVIISKLWCAKNSRSELQLRDVKTPPTRAVTRITSNARRRNWG
jgi:hypothetical protein